jgi:glycosyltransferase involved in cell wall biosynthesis
MAAGDMRAQTSLGVRLAHRLVDTSVRADGVQGRPLITVVLPLHNEEGSLDELHRRLDRVFAELPYEAEFIFVNDGSTDRSLAVLEQLSAADRRVKFISLSRNFGHQYALTAGLDYASGDAVISMDSDLQHPPEMIPQLIRQWETGFPVVYTIRRTTRDVSLFKRLTARVFYAAMRAMSPFPLESNTSDFRLLDRRVCDALKQSRERERFYRGMIPWVGFRQKALEFEADARFAGRPSYTLGKMLRFSINGILSYSYAPMYLLLTCVAAFVTACAAYSVLVLYQRFVTGQAPPGQTSILMTMIVIGTAQLLATCVTAVYAYKAYHETKARPLYIVDEVQGFDQ